MTPTIFQLSLCKFVWLTWDFNFSEVTGLIEGKLWIQYNCKHGEGCFQVIPAHDTLHKLHPFKKKSRYRAIKKKSRYRAIKKLNRIQFFFLSHR